ncbi:MAG TPA: acetamidase/formamidase family protein [Burkholderiales bacterium]|jgi:acetamidase/formamidase|nr:acetamidase/formamidase family protein [Burkholderiales bacterium]
MSATHSLKPSPKTVHWGYFDAALPPVLRIASGDRIQVETVSGSAEQMPKPPFTVPEDLKQIHAAVKPMLGPHILCGPVWVEGAEPGDTLQVDIEEMAPREEWGYNLIAPLRGSLPEDFPEGRLIHIPIDLKRRVATMSWGTEIPLRPFFGIMATAPRPGYGKVTSIVPREYGGNMDNKELIAGSTLYLPIFNPGAMFSVGDGHGVQGDGEVCLSALETALRGTLRLTVRKDMQLKFPRAETPNHYITMGMDEDLDDAAKQALREMIKLLQQIAGLSALDAYTLCSLACDLRVTQLVDGNKGVHAMITKEMAKRGK